MKQIILSLLSVSAFTLSAIAQETPAADNTSKNQRDRSGETRTPGDQSNSSEDVKITAAIRSAVLKEDSLSATAKNVKIITADGTVTLRGPVQNEAEKIKIAELAQSAAGNAPAFRFLKFQFYCPTTRASMISAMSKPPRHLKALPPVQPQVV